MNVCSDFLPKERKNYLIALPNLLWNRIPQLCYAIRVGIMFFNFMISSAHLPDFTYVISIKDCSYQTSVDSSLTNFSLFIACLYFSGGSVAAVTFPVTCKILIQSTINTFLDFLSKNRINSDLNNSPAYNFLCQVYRLCFGLDPLVFFRTVPVIHCKHWRNSFIGSW